jgi:aspartyl/glutamyl-tRNA(Asn/Gln) amidotransferase C subunit
MRITADEVRRIARLARIPVTDAELPVLARELSGVLCHLDAISRTAPGPTEVEHLEPAAPERDDEPVPGLDADALARMVPRWNPPYVVAPTHPALAPDGAE